MSTGQLCMSVTVLVYTICSIILYYFVHAESPHNYEKLYDNGRLVTRL